MSESADVPRVRVFLPTWRRPDLLPRAIASLRAQTLADWVCEVHNDDPADGSPGELVARLGDPRLQLITHATTLGGTAAFNLFFRAVAEPFYSLLEDDNWWEPEFLATMVATAAAHADVTVFWANMRVWQQQADGSFRDTGRLARQTAAEAPQRIDWGRREQIAGAVHSNGAALFRSRPGEDFCVPPVPFAGVEMFRERLFPHPLVFVPRPLANYSLTLRTARSHDHAEWTELQTMAAATFLKHARYDDARLAQMVADARDSRIPSLSALLLASLVEPGCRGLRRHTRPADWLGLLRSAVRRPHVYWRIFRSRRVHPDWWSWLDRRTAIRFAAERSRTA